MNKGRLFLLPTPLGENADYTLPQYTLDTMFSLRYFVAERARTARRFLKAAGYPGSLQDIHFEELNKDTPNADVAPLLQPLLNGFDLGLMSEAGCPGIADPGARLVAEAHHSEIEVVPMVGPSSIFLALMASGMGGQQFAFHGYLSPKRPQLVKDLLRLEKMAISLRQTQVFMETPYRNQTIIEEVLKNLNGRMRFAVAAELTLPSQFIRSLSIDKWKKSPIPDLHKRPAIFLISQ